MELTWYGHSCFKLETPQGSVVFDPYAPDYVPGLVLPPLEADLCLCSHGHSDHNYAGAVTLSGKLCALKVTKYPTFHDERGGTLRGRNTLHLVEAGGFRALHLGDLGHVLSQELAETLRPVDLLMLPVGGYYTIGPDEARQVAQQLRPRILVPMHFRGPGFGFEVLTTVEDFAKRMDNVLHVDSNILIPDNMQGPVTALLRCPSK